MYSQRVRMTIEWHVPTGQVRPMTMALHSLAGDTRGMRGCLGCSVSTDLSNQGTVRYTEDFLTEDDMRERVRDDSFALLITLLEETLEPPRVEFLLAKGTRGLDFAEELRSSTT